MRSMNEYHENVAIYPNIKAGQTMPSANAYENSRTVTKATCAWVGKQAGQASSLESVPPLQC